MIYDIGNVLCRLRTEKKISQRELAALLCEKGIEVTNQAVSKWENGTTQPSAVQFIALCDILGVYDVVGEFSGKKGGLLKGLNCSGREMAKEYINLLKLSDKYIEAEEKIIPIRKLPLYHISASAGTGQFLDSSNYELTEVGADVPDNANFGVRLAGDSMEPVYHNGDIVWVMQEQALNHGEVGIFLYDGDVYCKELDLSDGKVKLKSLNRNYDPILIKDDDSFRVFGKVVSRWNTEI
ncbi:MAG: helix-turn-helix domain-containing protein [Oscillospiraceae bacterium]|nr:helix-turn-helix domain-containing protein [Oscillospiraceae bacterium]